MALPTLKIPDNPYKLSTTADPLGINGANIPGVGSGAINLGPSPYAAPDAPTIMSAFVQSLEPTRQAGYENVKQLAEQRGSVGSGAEYKAYGKYDAQLGQDVLNKYGEVYGQGQTYNQNQYNWETSKLESMYNTIYKAKELDPMATTADKNIALWLKSKLTGAPYTPIDAATGKPSATPYNATTMEPIAPTAPGATVTPPAAPTAPTTPTPATPANGQTMPVDPTTIQTDWKSTAPGGFFKDSTNKLYKNEGGIAVALSPEQYTAEATKTLAKNKPVGSTFEFTDLNGDKKQYKVGAGGAVDYATPEEFTAGQVQSSPDFARLKPGERMAGPDGTYEKSPDGKTAVNIDSPTILPTRVANVGLGIEASMKRYKENPVPVSYTSGGIKMYITGITKALEKVYDTTDAKFDDPAYIPTPADAQTLEAIQKAFIKINSTKGNLTADDVNTMRSLVERPVGGA